LSDSGRSVEGSEMMAMPNEVGEKLPVPEVRRQHQAHPSETVSFTGLQLGETDFQVEEGIETEAVG